MSLKKLIVAAVLVLGIALIAVSGAMLYRGIGRFSGVGNTLERAWRDLNKLYAQEPFPSAANAAAVRDQARRLDAERDALLEALGAGQLEAPRKTPAQFNIFLTDRQRALVRLARENGVKVADDFAFGFELYFGTGRLPTPERDIPSRLAQQLLMVEELCRVLFGARVARLDTVKRDAFPQEEQTGAPVTKAPQYGRNLQPAPAGPKTEPGVMGEGEMYTRLHFDFTLASREAALLEALNRLAAHPMFVVVTRVKTTKDDPDFAKPLQTRAAEVAGGSAVVRRGKHPPRVERMVSGEELELPMLVELGVDVYLFRRNGT